MVLLARPGEVFQHRELLHSIGLGIPQAAELTQQLIAEGYPLPADLYTPEEVAEALLKLPRKEAESMLKDITLGQYLPGKSLIHRLDPRTKILLTIVYIADDLLRVQPGCGTVIPLAFADSVLPRCPG